MDIQPVLKSDVLFEHCLLNIVSGSWSSVVHRIGALRIS